MATTRRSSPRRPPRRTRPPSGTTLRCTPTRPRATPTPTTPPRATSTPTTPSSTTTRATPSPPPPLPTLLADAHHQRATLVDEVAAPGLLRLADSPQLTVPHRAGQRIVCGRQAPFSAPAGGGGGPALLLPGAPGRQQPGRPPPRSP